MLKNAALLATLLCTSLLLFAPVVHGDENLNFEPIPRQTLLDYLAGKATFTLIDARTAEEFEAGHIYGAVHVAHDADLATSAALPTDPNAPVVVYCKSGKRAEALQSSMLALGYTNVRVLGPSQMLWADELPVFNCGAVETLGTELATVNSPNSTGGNRP